MTPREVFDQQRPAVERLARNYLTYKYRAFIDPAEICQIALASLWTVCIKHHHLPASVVAVLAQKRARGAVIDHLRNMGFGSRRHGYIHPSKIVPIRFEPDDDDVAWRDRAVQLIAPEPVESDTDERLPDVLDAVERLPERLRNLIREIYFNETPQHVLAVRMERSAPRISQLRTRALQLLRIALGG